ncbi:MAG: phosphoribosyl-ATP diphosphatase [Chloroflexi bacterium]|nr:phosphoribosyl-ATP diphosphatase [Chloroflexota bacterium]
MREGSIIEQVYDVIMDRKRNPRPDSYTNRLLSEGQDRILQKVGEETIEFILAAKSDGKERVIAEMADLVYHLLVAMAYHDLTLAEVSSELRRRMKS